MSATGSIDLKELRALEEILAGPDLDEITPATLAQPIIRLRCRAATRSHLIHGE